MSPTEVTINGVLSGLGYKFLQEVSFEGCTNPDTGRYFRYDFYIPSLNLIIEYDGIQHNEPYFIITDKLKNRFCYLNGIDIARFNTSDYYNLTDKVYKLVKKGAVTKNLPVRKKNKKNKPVVITQTRQELLHEFLGFSIDYILSDMEIRILQETKDNIISLPGGYNSLKKSRKKAFVSLLKRNIICKISNKEYKIQKDYYI